MARRLAVAVAVMGQGGSARVYLPDEEIPADVAAGITNDEVWAEVDGEEGSAPERASRRRPRPEVETAVAGAPEVEE